MVSYSYCLYFRKKMKFKTKRRYIIGDSSLFHKYGYFIYLIDEIQGKSIKLSLLFPLITSSSKDLIFSFKISSLFSNSALNLSSKYAKCLFIIS